MPFVHKKFRHHVLVSLQDRNRWTKLLSSTDFDLEKLVRMYRMTKLFGTKGMLLRTVVKRYLARLFKFGHHPCHHWHHPAAAPRSTRRRPHCHCRGPRLAGPNRPSCLSARFGASYKPYTFSSTRGSMQSFSFCSTCINCFA